MAGGGGSGFSFHTTRRSGLNPNIPQQIQISSKTGGETVGESLRGGGREDRREERRGEEDEEKKKRRRERGTGEEEERR